MTKFLIWAAFSVLFFVHININAQELELRILGSDSLETDAVEELNYLRFHNDFNALKAEVDSVQRQLFKKGYIENRLLGINTTNDSLFLATFKLHTKYDSIYIYGVSDIKKSVLKAISKTITDAYFVVAIPKIESVLTYLNSKIAEAGKPFSTLQLQHITVIENRYISAQLIAKADSVKRRVNDIVIKGYEKFPKAYLKHYLKIKPEQLFNLKKIKTQTALLNNLPFANQIKDPEVLFTKDSTVLYLYVEKIKSNAFDGFIGFTTNESNHKLEFSGYADLTLQNNLNFGEVLQIKYKADEGDQKTLDINTVLPYLFKTPLGMELDLDIFSKDSTFTTVKQEAKLFYQLNSMHKVLTGIKGVNSTSLLENNNTTVNTINDYETLFYNIGYEYVKRNPEDLLFKTRRLFYIEVGFGSRKFLNTTVRQTELAVNAHNIFKINPRNNIFFRVKGATVLSDNYLENELIRFGGINSLRGFEENSLLATLYTVINTEYRYSLNSGFYLHSIIDAAYFQNNLTNQGGNLYGFGFGFGLLTQAGLLKFNYANGKQEDTPFKLSNSKIHLSLTVTF